MSEKKSKKIKKSTSKKKVVESVKISKEELENLRNEVEAEKDKNLRLFAEFDNFRKRTAKERIELFTTASKDVITSLIPVLDNFERALQAQNTSDDDGIMLIYKQLKGELEKKGLKEMEDPKGKALDTDFHEAITNIPAQDKKDIGKIIDVIEKGYLLGDKVLRYAKVVVGN
ncbi:MAG: nucleotide exchange factor GrpE [Flavobacteriales bacterium]|jgi:molecular chaperone GrpE|nr:nucleotide exchange factor GrpE [Flavobacteriales bacterium]|tara:strand:- start:1239 stop:1754 length:516 start_codon:yes stop_codon:yes gene_type:complete